MALLGYKTRKAARAAVARVLNKMSSTSWIGGVYVGHDNRYYWTLRFGVFDLALQVDGTYRVDGTLAHWGRFMTHLPICLVKDVPDPQAAVEAAAEVVADASGTMRNTADTLLHQAAEISGRLVRGDSLGSRSSKPVPPVGRRLTY